MSLSQRIATGLALGAAALALPLAASPASADDWHYVGSVGGDYDQCMSNAHSFVHEEDNDHDYTEYKCEANGDAWRILVR